MKKNLLNLILIVFCSIFFFGCANIEYQRFVNPDGSIEDVLIVEVAESVDALVVAEILNDIRDDAKHYYETPVNNAKLALLDAEIMEGIKVTINPPSTAFRSIKITTWCANLEMYSVLVKDIFPVIYKQNAEQTEETNSTGITYDISAFIIKYIETTQNAFGNIEQFELQLANEATATNFYDKYVAQYGGENFNKSDIKLTQMYVSSDTRLQSNATATQIQNGMKYHLWEISADDADFQLQFYYKTANAVGWYYLALGLTLVFVVVLVIVLVRKTGKKKPVYKEEIEIIDFDEQNKDF